MGAGKTEAVVGEEDGAGFLVYVQVGVEKAVKGEGRGG